MIGAVIGATMIVVLTACFPQDRIFFLGLHALWGGICAFADTTLRNFASCSAALAGYTAAIIAADNLVHDGAEVSALVSVYALINRMRVLSRSDVVEKAEAVVRTIVETYFAPNKWSGPRS